MNGFGVDTIFQTGACPNLARSLKPFMTSNCECLTNQCGNARNPRRRRDASSNQAAGKFLEPPPTHPRFNPRMKATSLIIVTSAALLLAGCARSQRSISNSGYQPETGYHSYRPQPVDHDRFAYRGELSEFDLLGVNRNQFVTEEQISHALDTAQRVRLVKGKTILLIQSGATFPDGEMVKALEQHFRVVPFSGVPPEGMRDAGAERNQPAYARTFRLAAAQAGASHIVCYWGVLESLRSDMNTKSISWVPIAGWVLPDENQAMRLRLKLAVIDVRSGSWTVVSPESFVDRNSRSNRYNRDRADQKQVQELKELAYAKGVEELVSATLK
jgi:hypothetical protein